MKHAVYLIISSLTFKKSSESLFETFSTQEILQALNLGDSDASDELPRLGAAAVSEAEEEKLELSPAKARRSSLRATRKESQERSN